LSHAHSHRFYSTSAVEEPTPKNNYRQENRKGSQMMAAELKKMYKLVAFMNW